MAFDFSLISIVYQQKAIYDRLKGCEGRFKGCEGRLKGCALRYAHFKSVSPAERKNFKMGFLNKSKVLSLMCKKGLL